MANFSTSLKQALNVTGLAVGNDLVYHSKNLWKPKLLLSRGVFGGQLVGQALMAAVKSVDGPEFLLHSTHCYFLSPVKPEPIVYEVDKSRDGRTFCSRSVKAIQDGKTVFLCLASFYNDIMASPEDPAAAAKDVSYSNSLFSMPEVPSPETSSSQSADGHFVNAPLPFNLLATFGIDSQAYISSKRMENQTGNVSIFAWMKAKKDYSSEDHQNIHRVALSCVSDFAMPTPIILMNPNIKFGLVSSLDHSVWFHEPVNFAAWNLFVVQCDNAVGGTALNTTRVYSKKGTLVATCKQESLCKPKL